MDLPQTEVRDSERLADARARFGSRVVVSEPFPGRPPLWIEPADAALRTDLDAAVAWMTEHHAAIEEALLTFGAVLWRGFPLADSDDFAAVMGRFTSYSQGYVAGTTDRKAVKGQVMEATRTPPEVYILLHQEMSYLPSNPRLVALFCKEPSPVGGETPICDVRGLLEALPDPLRRKLVEENVRYVRNMRSEAVNDWRAEAVYRHPVWEYRFDTTDRAVVEAQLKERGVGFEWEDDGGLTFWTELPGIVTHPVTGDRLFFNQMNSQIQHRLSVGEERAGILNAAYGDSVRRPFSVAFGDGEPLREDEFMAIHEEFERRKVVFSWQAGDFVIVENKLTAHGRHPFSGPRDVQVMLLE
jgi:alpha-ketoglutarate-dependent taurine dioxygenase